MENFRRYSIIDSRIRYIRQSLNIGVFSNCQFLLDVVRGEYYVRVATDDTRSENLLELNVVFLDAQSEFVGATCAGRFEGTVAGSREIRDGRLDQPLEHERYLSFYNG